MTIQQKIEAAIRAAIAAVPGLDKLPDIERFEVITDAIGTVNDEFVEQFADAEMALEGEEDE
jgi:hypothetical protein